MEHRDNDMEDRDTEQWNYLDGSPASTPDPQLRTYLEKTVSDVTSFLNPLNWFMKKKPSRPAPPQKQPTLRMSTRVTNVTQRNIGVKPAAVQVERPVKRPRPSHLRFGELDLDQSPGNPTVNGMPPNVEFMEDERPSRSDYMTEDEDSDTEMAGTLATPSKNAANIKQLTASSRNTRSTLNSPLATRSPLVERKDLSARNSASWTPQNSHLLPRVSNTLKQSTRHPLMEHVVKAAPKPVESSSPSRKRGFADVDNETTSTWPKLYSTVPRSSERLPSSFGAQPNRFKAALGTSKIPVPHYTLSRYTKQLNLSKPKLSVDNDIRLSESKISAFQRPVVSGRDVLPSSSSIPASPQRHKNSVKMDCSFVIPPSQPCSAKGQNFLFGGRVIVPAGELQRDLYSSDGGCRKESQGDAPKPKEAEEKLRDRSSGRNISGGMPHTVVQSSASDTGLKRNKMVQDERADVEEMRWTCSLCADDNPAASTACRGCGKEKQAPKKTVNAPPKEQETPQPVAAVELQPSKKLDESKTLTITAVSGTKPRTEEKRENVDSPVPVSETSTSKARETTQPVVDIWAKAAAATGWTCSGCWSTVKAEDDACRACGAAKPGAASKTADNTPKSTVAPTINFGTFAGFSATPSASTSIFGSQSVTPISGGSTTTSVVPFQPIAVPSFGGFSTTGVVNGKSVENTVSQPAPTSVSVAPSFVLPPLTATSSSGFVFGSNLPNTAVTAQPAFSGFPSNGFATGPPISAPAPVITSSGFFGDLSGIKATAAAPVVPSFSFGPVVSNGTFGTSTVFGGAAVNALVVSSAPSGIPAPGFSFVAPQFGAALTGGGLFGHGLQNGQTSLPPPTGISGGINTGALAPPQPAVFGQPLQAATTAPATFGATGSFAAAPGRRLIRGKRNFNR